MLFCFSGGGYGYVIIIIIIIINRDLKSLPVIKNRSRLYNDGKEKKSEKNINVKMI